MKYVSITGRLSAIMKKKLSQVVEEEEGLTLFREMPSALAITGHFTIGKTNGKAGFILPLWGSKQDTHQ